MLVEAYEEVALSERKAGSVRRRKIDSINKGIFIPNATRAYFYQQSILHRLKSFKSKEFFLLCSQWW